MNEQIGINDIRRFPLGEVRLNQLILEAKIAVIAELAELREMRARGVISEDVAKKVTNYLCDIAATDPTRIPPIAVALKTLGCMSDVLVNDYSLAHVKEKPEYIRIFNHLSQQDIFDIDNDYGSPSV